MNIAQSIDRFSAADASRRGWNADFTLVFDVSMIHTTPGGIGNSAHRQRCGSCCTKKSLSRKRSAQSARQLSRITARLCPTTSSPKGWEGLGETTTPKMFRLLIGGAISKRDRDDYIPGSDKAATGLLGCRTECPERGWSSLSAAALRGVVAVIPNFQRAGSVRSKGVSVPPT